MVLLAPRRRATRVALFDVVIFTVAAAVLVWVVFIANYATAPGVTAVQSLVTTMYPLLDLAMLAAAGLLVFTAYRSLHVALLFAWVATMLIGDVIFTAQVLEGSYQHGTAVFAWWLVGMALKSAAALAPAPAVRMAPRWLRRTVIVAGVLPLPVLLAVRSVQSSLDGVGVIAAGSLAVTGLVLARLWWLDRGSVTPELRMVLRRSALRLGAGFVALALLPLAGLTVLAVRQADATVEAEVRQRLSASADTSVTHVAAQMAGLQDLVASYADRQLVANTITAGGPQARTSLTMHLDSLRGRNADFLGTWILDPTGREIASSPHQDRLVGADFSHREYFQTVMRTGAPYVSAAFQSQTIGDAKVVAVAAPIVRDGRLLGVLVLGYRMEAVTDFAARLGSGQRVSVTVVDQAGKLLTADDAAGATPGANDPDVAAALAGRSGTVRAVEDGTEVLAAYRPVPSLGWAVQAEVSVEQAFAGAADFTGRVLAVATLLGQLLLAGMVVAIRADRRRRIAEADLTGREEQVSTILDAAGDAFVCVDAAGRVIRWNRQAQAVFGWTDSEILGQSLIDCIVPAADRAEVTASFQTAAVSGPSRSANEVVELPLRRRDGQAFPAEGTLWWTGTADDRRLSCFLRDITDRKRAEAELAAAHDAAVQASRLKSEFVANMSHEIRTPMNGVIGLTSLLLETGLDERQRSYLTTVQNSADALLTVINDILDFSKIEAGKLEIETVDVDVRAITEDVVGLMAASAQAKGLEITSVVSLSMPTTVRGDGHRIRQVLTNLVSNAVKFTEAGEVTVEVSAVPSGTACEVTFAITDTGVGIPADRQATLFEAFTQADASTTRRYGGTGLGLTISRQLVELMGGSIGVVSEPGRGSRFRFTLPLPVAVGAVAPSPVSEARLLGTRVLVVDDNATNRTVVADVLTGWGMRPHPVADANAALGALHAAADAEQPFAVALLDMHMPGLDGLDLARIITADTGLRTTRLAMLTSTDQVGEAQAARDCGIEAYLTKPIRTVQLRTALQRLLGETTPASTAVPVPRVATNGATARRGRILVAEDNEVNQQVVAELLASLDYTADIAADGEQALALLRTGAYDAVLMDCQMPRMDGYTATAHIRRLPAPQCNIPIVALTASALTSDRQRCHEAGMDAFLSKPVRKHDLNTALTDVLAPRPGIETPSTPQPDTTGAAEGADAGLFDPDMFDDLRDTGGRW
jgi:PAS domain S-box-containing protein